MNIRIAQAVLTLVVLPVDFPAAANPEVPQAGPATMGELIFPHDEHVDDLELECVDCHHETNAAALVTPHDEYFDDFWIDCQICHVEQGAVEAEPQSCSNCHHSYLGDVADQTLSSKVVIHRKCWSCHEVGTGAEATGSCAQCHTSAEQGS